MSTLAAETGLPGDSSRPPLPLRLRGSRASGVLLIAALLVLWECSARLGWVTSQSWPPFSGVIVAFVQGIAGGEILTALLATLRRMAVGYGLGCAAGVALGLLMGASRWFRWIVRPLVEVVRPIPAPAIIPPLILLLGVDDALKIFIVALASFFPACLATMSGVSGVDPVLIDTARTFRTGRVRTVASVLFPVVLPSIMAGLRTATGLALVVTVVAEMIAGASGIGYHIIQMQYAMKPEAMYASVMILALTGYGLNRLFLVLEARAVPWMGKS